MTLLICIFAAIIVTIKWYQRKDDSMMLGTLGILYWGASLMWMGDAIWGYIEDGAEFFTPAAEDMLNDAYLGFSVVALGMILWLVILLIRDPKGVVKATLKKKAAK